MPAPDASLERLRAALGELAHDDVAELLAEARADARARVRATLADALEEAMLARVSAQLSEEPAQLSEEPAQLSEEPAQLSEERQTSARPATEHNAPVGEHQPPTGDDRSAFYVYGVLRRGDAQAAEDLVGLWGTEVDALLEGDLAAVVSEVPRRDFDESALRTHLADMEWVESVARAHEGVLDHLCTHATVIPMRMCTVYHSDLGVREMLGREATTLREALELLEGKREWGVQAFFLRSQAARSAEIGAEEPATGAGYLEQRREERDLDERLDELVDEAVEEIHELLAGLAVDSALNSPHRREASGHPGDMVLNGVYLVEDEKEEAFAEQVRALGSAYAGRGIELGITGPWPPYNFLPGSIGATW